MADGLILFLSILRDVLAVVGGAVVVAVLGLAVLYFTSPNRPPPPPGPA